MKKFLSLVLAMIMVMSLVTVGAGATFTDDAAITNTEAVEVMSALGILSGSNGAFDPTGTLTRGAAAKIITYMLVGTAKAEAIAAAGLSEKPFSDVPATSATAPFIAYCADKGIVGGYTDGTFQRSNPVSGNAFIKMVLVALGEKEIDFTAKGWQVEAVAKAEEMGLLDGIADDVLFSANLTRENAAQIAFNGMKYVGEGAKSYFVGEVEFDDVTDAALYAALVGGTVEQKTDLAKSLAGKNYKLAVLEELVILSTPETAYDQEYVKAIEYSNIDKIGAENESVYHIELDTEVSADLIGHIVDVYYQDSKADGVEGGYDYSETEGESEKVYCVSVLSNEVTTAKKTGLTYTQVNDLLGTKLTKEDGKNTSYTLPSKTHKVANSVVTATTTSNIVKYETKPTYKGLTVAAGTYIVFENEIVAAKTTSTAPAAFTITITNEDKGYYNVKNEAGTKIVEVVADADDCYTKVLTEIDWLALVEEGKTTETVAFISQEIGGFYQLSEIKTVTGAVTKIDLAASTTAVYMYIDGTKYTVKTNSSSQTPTQYAGAVEALNAAYVPTAMASVDEDYTVFYLDGDGKIFAYGEAEEVAIAGSLIVPVYTYAKYTEVEQKTDEYGKDLYEADEIGFFYTIWVQAVNAQGTIVNLQVEPTAKYDGVETEDEAIIAEIAATGTAYVSGLEKAFYTYKTVSEKNWDNKSESVAELTLVDASVTNATKGQGAVAADTDSAAKKVVGEFDSANYTFYLADDFKVMYIDGEGSELKVTLKTGTAAQIEAGAVVYGEKAKNDSAFELKLVLAADGFIPNGDGVIYVKGEMNTKIPTKYVDDEGEIGDAYEQTVYVDGSKLTILVSADEITAVNEAMGAKKAGFFTYKVVDGLYDLTAYAGDAVVKESISTIYKTMYTVAGADDIDFTGAKVVNMLSSSSAMGYDDVPTDATKLVKDGTTLSFVYDDDTKSVDVIYVIAYADQD